MKPTIAAASSTDRATVSVYWIPGCSSCVKVKEFVAEHGLEYESVNVLDHPDAMEELEAAGLRSVPAVRNGHRFAYAQSLDDVASLLGVTHRHARLPPDVLLRRWDAILSEATGIVAAFDEDVLRRPVVPQRERTIRELCVHTFQVAESFRRQVADDTIDARAIYLNPRADLATRDAVLDYLRDVHDGHRSVFLSPGCAPLPERLSTHYGLQPSILVLERGVWHSAQHARQLDFVSAGMGAELRIADELYAGLPMPTRLWA